jgi:hypothetical protein
VLLVASSSEDLERDDPGRRECLVGSQRLSDTTVSRAAGGSLELDPR